MTDLDKSALDNEPGVPAAPSVDGLIARLEEANAGNGELDARVIAAVVGGDATAAESPLNGRWCVYSGGLDRNGKPRLWEPGNQRERELRRSYIEDRGPTRSVDTALALVTPAWRVYALQEEYIYPPGAWFAGLDHRTQHYLHGSKMGKGATAALALCIAALRARHSVPQPECVSDRTTSNTDAAQETPSGTPIAGGGR